MNIMEKAQKRAILMIDTEYVFNDIYFGEEGMTSTSANHASAMANVMVQDIKNRLMGLRLYEKSIRVIGDAEVTACCSIGDESVGGVPYAEIVEKARLYIHTLGGFEKFAEWGLVRPGAEV